MTKKHSSVGKKKKECCYIQNEADHEEDMNDEIISDESDTQASLFCYMRDK